MSDDRLRRAYAEELKQNYLKSGFKQGFEAGYAKAKEDFDTFKINQKNCDFCSLRNMCCMRGADMQFRSPVNVDDRPIGGFHDD